MGNQRAKLLSKSALNKIIFSIFLVYGSLSLAAQSSIDHGATTTSKTESTVAAKAPVLTMASPASAGMLAERLARIDDLVREYVDKKWVAGAVILVARNGKIVYYKGLGYDDIDKKTSMKKDAIFRIASQTKAITSVAVMMLYEEGKILLNDPISKYIPE